MTQNTPTLDQFVASLKGLDPEQMKEMVERRHPEYDEHEPQWEFLEETYEGGREWFKTNIFRYVKEGDQEHKDRVMRAFRFNHTREIVDLVNKYIFKANILRKDTVASTEVQSFWRTSTLNRRPITDFMRLVSRASSTFGRAWVCTDSNKNDSETTVELEKASGARVYAYIVKPQNVLDFAYNDDGDLSWIKVREFVRDDETMLSAGTVRTQYRVWTENYWVVITEEPVGKDDILYQVAASGEHNLGRVPLFPVDHTSTDSQYIATGLIDDIAYLDRAVANYLSNLDAIIQDQTFSQLVMPAQSMIPGDDSETKIMDMGMKRIFTYDAQGGTAPQYISPDASNAEVILSVINKIINEIYHSVGMAGERTKQDNSMGIDNSSGVAKAYDFDRMNAMLASKARSLEVAENTLCELVDTWFGKTVEPGSYDIVVYPDTFDVRGLDDELDLAATLQLIGAPDKVRQNQMDSVVDKLFPNLAENIITQMKSEISAAWPVQAPPPPTMTNQPKTKPSQENRQGQVTEDTVN